ncbi:MAG: hypothetical protein F4X97_15645 [Boseongicola sp. SB0662_bin_57]|nr:hypothetical protein [Boseongicola sp. SB0662_bin_57]
MSGTKRISRLPDDEILKRNKKIDSKLVSAQVNLERRLKGLGVEVKPEFKVEPPLGRGKMRLFSRNF